MVNLFTSAMQCCDSRANLVILKTSVERNANGLEKQQSISVVSRRGLDSDVATGDHLGRVPSSQVSIIAALNIEYRDNLRIIIDLHLRKQRNLIRRQTKADIPTSITRRPLNTLPLLNLGQHNIHKLA